MIFIFLKKKIKSIACIIFALGMSILVGQAFYWLVDLNVYNYIMDTVTTGPSDQLAAHVSWYASNEWLLFIVEFLINISVTMILLKFVVKLPSREIKGWLSIRNIRQLALGLLLGTIAISAVFIILILIGHAHVISWQPQFTADIFKFLLVFILVGISEELFYRGLVITCLRTFQNKLFVILLSGIIFSLIHFYNSDFHPLAFLNIFLIGVLFAYIFIKTGSLWLPIGYHILWNYFQGSVYGFNVSGIKISGIFTTEYSSYTVFNGGTFGPEAGLITTGATLLVFLFLNRYWIKKASSSLKSDISNAD